MDGFDWACTGVYGPDEDGHKGALWEELERVCSRWVIPWCLIGDFNIIRYIGERLGCDSYSSTKCAFLNFIENNNLVYLPLEGASYTWFRDSDAPSMSRIDRNLVLID